MKRFTFLILLFPFFSSAQFRNNIWCFGDSAGIDFSNVNNPVPISSGMDGRGSCANISDDAGQLLFYAFTVANTAGKTTRVFNKLHSLMNNGDSIVGEGWYQELVIVPFPDSNGFYYLFSIGCNGPPSGLFYSIININANAGFGEVVIKNVQLNNLYAFDGLSAVMHGNGRDWWLIFKPEGYQNPPNNDFYIYLISPSGISSPNIQSIGGIISTNAGSISYSIAGDRIVMVDYKNLIQLFNFDRCTGNLSSNIIIEPENTAQTGGHWGSCFSPNSQVLYVTHVLDGPGYIDSRLYQYDLTAANIALSRDTIFHAVEPNQLERLKLGPDEKIYLSTWYLSYVPGFPYPDSIRNTTNENLSVINSPDSLGLACDFQPFSFYLGGKRTYAGLPNNPDYELPAWGGSICDTLGLPNAVNQGMLPVNQVASLNVFYHHDWQTAFINATGLKGKNYSLHLINLEGKEIAFETGVLSSEYFTKNLPCNNLSAGVYIVLLETEKDRLIEKFIIE